LVYPFGFLVVFVGIVKKENVLFVGIVKKENVLFVGIVKKEILVGIVENINPL
jgi:hypothetical protein